MRPNTEESWTAQPRHKFSPLSPKVWSHISTTVPISYCGIFFAHSGRAISWSICVSERYKMRKPRNWHQGLTWQQTNFYSKPYFALSARDYRHIVRKHYPGTERRLSLENLSCVVSRGYSPIICQQPVPLILPSKAAGLFLFMLIREFISNASNSPLHFLALTHDLIILRRRWGSTRVFKVKQLWPSDLRNQWMIEWLCNETWGKKIGDRVLVALT